MVAVLALAVLPIACTAAQRTVVADAAAVTVVAAALDAASAHDASVQDPDLSRLAAMLDARGPDGRLARETAAARLAEWGQLDGHRILHDWLRRETDPEGVRSLVLAALQRHLLAAPSRPFQGAAEAERRRILLGYLQALAPLWRDGSAEDPATLPLRLAARDTIQCFPSADLSAALAALLDGEEARAIGLRCIADLQLVHLAPLLAAHLESTDATVRSVARRSLQLLTFHDEEFATKAQFDAWYEQFGGMRYVDLAERAARRQPLLLERLRDERRRLIVESAVEFVRAYTTRTPGLAWQAIGSRTLVDDPAVLDACLEQLQKALVERLPGEEDPAGRQAFCRGLLSRLKLVAPDQVRRRALLLEVAAYCVRLEETDLVTEVTGMLVAQLEHTQPEARFAALRGLRRFPGVDTRTRLVRHANALALAPAAAKAELELALAVLASRTAPRWSAPAEADADRADWLALVRTVCALPDSPDLRSKGLDLALTLDAKDQRVAEVYDLLIALAGDATVTADFRATCLIHLRGWLDLPTVADPLVAKLQGLLADPAPEVRQKAAEALSRLPELTDPRRSDWMAATIALLRDRLPVEPSASVLPSLVNVMQTCGRQPQMAERAIGALKVALAALPSPVPEDQRPRLEAMLLALSTIAADPSAARGPWLGACPQLLEHGKRSSLRLILQSHAALELAKDVANADGALRERAQAAMQVVIRTALLKPPSQPWNSSEELLRESRDVRTAFAALDPLEESLRLDLPEHRLLRLEVEVAGGKFQEAATRAQAWLTAAPVPGRPVRTPAQTAWMRHLAAEALLGQNKPADALKVLGERDPEAPLVPGGVDLQLRIARALLATQPREAAALLDRAYRATPPEDPNFRARLLEWGQAQLRADPGLRETVITELERFSALFESRDCPPEQRDAYAALRGQR